MKRPTPPRFKRAFQTEEPGTQIAVMGTLREFRQHSAGHPPDLALLDLKPAGWPRGGNPDQSARGRPVSHHGNDELWQRAVAVEAIKAGALDYVVKSAEAFAMMPRTVERALREWKLLTERREAVAAQQRLIAQLEEALSKVKTLSGLLPICSACKKIRDDQGYWSQVEGYIQEHTDARFTHSYCPECARKFLSKVERSDPNTQ